MNRKSYPYVIFILSLYYFTSCNPWVMPKDLAGKWVSIQEVTVRFKKNGEPYQFRSDTVSIEININENGGVTGSVGSAALKGCEVSNNRSWFGKTLNIKTDFIIIGELNGNIFDQDTLKKKNINLPFNLKNNVIEGTLFQKRGMGAFPMVNLHLVKQ